MNNPPRCRIHIEKSKTQDWPKTGYYSDYGTDAKIGKELARLIHRDISKYKIKSVEDKAEVPKARRSAIVREALRQAAEKYSDSN